MHLKVRNQESSFGEAFRDLIQRISPTDDEGSRWRTALTEAGGNYGFFGPNFQSKNQNQVIQTIVEHVRFVLDTARIPFSSGGLVGVRSQLLEVMTMLHEHRSKDVVSIGIWGMAGIGKTTLARLIFEQIKNEFESTCFLENVREEWERKDRVSVDINIEARSLKWKERHCHKKVLVVLDDVNCLEQLEALCGSRNSLRLVKGVE